MDVLTDHRCATARRRGAVPVAGPPTAPPGTALAGRPNLSTAAEIAAVSAKLEEPSKNQILVVHDGSVIGYSTIRWWQERDDTWLYLHRGYLLPQHRRRGIGSAMLSWAEERIRQLVEQHGTTRTAVIGANAMTSEQDATALLLTASYRRVFSLVELGLGDLQRSPEQGASRDTDGADRDKPLPCRLEDGRRFVYGRRFHSEMAFPGLRRHRRPGMLEGRVERTGHDRCRPLLDPPP